MPTDDGPEEPPPVAGEITELLRRWRSGDPEALDRLTPLVYGELKRLARAQLYGHREARTLNPTALVNELYVRLLRRPAMAIEDRRHFFSLAARLLRQALVDHVRERAAQKRGGDAVTVALAEHLGPASAPAAVELLDLDRALLRLRAHDAQVERLVELRYFAGLTIEESAAALGRSAATVSRDWTFARAFLFRELAGGESSTADGR